MERYRFSDDERAFLEEARIPFAIYQFVDKRVVTLILSDGFCQLFGYEDRDKAYFDMDNDMYKATHTEDAARIADAAFRFATEGGDYDVVYRSMNRDGLYDLIHAKGVHYYKEDGVRLAQVWYTWEGICDEDSTSDAPLTATLKNALFEEIFLKASYYDHLTGLPGMTYFLELADIQARKLREQGASPVLLFTDFSGMKYFNHRHGFAEGDRLLQSFARMLADRFGNENCGRLGQDHFAVITLDEGLEDRIRELFRTMGELNEGRTLPLHVGIYQHWAEGIVPSMACDRAKFACDTLRNLFSSEFSYYDMSMKDTEDKQQYIIANLDKAIQERWIKVYYQPIVRAVNGRVCDEEALARWIDPVKGFMSPADFIPILEDHRLIYKLDLFVVECVLQKIKTLSGAGLSIVPQSVNLSRSDFECCDIVEEITKRVDAFGLDHSVLTIEITESIIGKDLSFIKAQVDRFRALGFAVWMDDFGSGYSSLDVLQSLNVDLIKFDMRFMQKFDEGDKVRTILTELIHMATSLGIDTVCEGVETEEQVVFLKETGCSKLQGYYYDKPIPVEKILEKYAKGIQIGFEDPEQSGYFDAVGRVDLHDLSFIAKSELQGLDSVFSNMPMGVIEVLDGQLRFARCNQAYREFVRRFYHMDIDELLLELHDFTGDKGGSFYQALIKSAGDDDNHFIEEYMGDDVLVRSCLHRIAVDGKTGVTAVAVAVLSVVSGDNGATYAHISRALAADYSSLYYVNIRTEQFIEYSTRIGGESITVERRGEDFFEESRKDALEYIYVEDRDMFISAFTKENVLGELDRVEAFTATYRLMVDGEPVYVSMKAMRMRHDPEHIIIGVRNIDSFMQQKLTLENIRRNKLTYSRIMALFGDIICMYTVDLETDFYFEYNASDEYKGLGFATHGKRFFDNALVNSLGVMAPEDQEMFRELFKKETILGEIQRSGSFSMSYRLMMAGEPVRVGLRAALVTEDDGEKLLIGVYRQDS